MALIVKKYRIFGYDVLPNTFEPLLRDFIKIEILEKLYGEQWVLGIPSKVRSFISDYRNFDFDVVSDLDRFMEEIGIVQLKQILLMSENFQEITGFFGEISKTKLGKLLNFLNSARIKIAHAKSSYSQIDFEKTNEALVELCKGIKSRPMIDYIRNQGYKNAKIIPDGFFQEYDVQNNLPTEEYELEGGFVGREKEITLLLDYIDK